MITADMQIFVDELVTRMAEGVRCTLAMPIAGRPSRCGMSLAQP